MRDLGYEPAVTDDGAQTLTWVQEHEFAATLRHIAEGDLPVEDLITAKVGLDGVAGAFEALADPEEHAKILIDPWADDSADDSEESS